MKIGIVRGDFANPWELQNFVGLGTDNDVSVFVGKQPIADLSKVPLKTVRLFSPVDLNSGHISRWKMAVLNRLFVDAHVLFGLENALKGFDIAHCAETYYSYTRQCIHAKKMGHIKKVVSTVWENIPFNNEGIAGRRKFKQKAYKNIDLFLAVTQGAKKALEIEGCPAEKITVLNPGIDLSVFYPQKVQSHLGLHKNKNIKILFVGRLEKEKGISDLIADFQKLSHTVKNLELVIAGSGSLESFVRTEAEKNHGIKFLGKVSYSDLPNLYSICDVYYHPAKGTSTWTEQYGMVLVEAMACGLPVVSVDSGSIKEVVGQLETSLEKVVKDPGLRKKMSAYGLRRVKEKYDSLKYAKQLEKIYSDLLRN